MRAVMPKAGHFFEKSAAVLESSTGAGEPSARQASFAHCFEPTSSPACGRRFRMRKRAAPPRRAPRRHILRRATTEARVARDPKWRSPVFHDRESREIERDQRSRHNFVIRRRRWGRMDDRHLCCLVPTTSSKSASAIRSATDGASTACAAMGVDHATVRPRSIALERPLCPTIYRAASRS